MASTTILVSSAFKFEKMKDFSSLALIFFFYSSDLLITLNYTSLFLLKAPYTSADTDSLYWDFDLFYIFYKNSASSYSSSSSSSSES